MNRLDGVRVVVTSPTGAAAGLSGLLADRGAVVVPLPVFAITEPSSWNALDAALEHLGGYAWVVFTSRNGVEGFLARFGDRSLPEGVRIAVVGSATGTALERSGIDADLIPETFTGVDLASQLGQSVGRVLLVRVEDGPPETPDALRSRGWDVDEVAAYRNVPLDPTGTEADAVRSGDFDCVALMSPSAARGFARVLGAEPLPERAMVACIGPTTARVAAEAGLRVDVAAEPHTAEGLVDALATAWATRPEMGP